MIEVAQKKQWIPLVRDEVKLRVFLLGDGWRLPTKKELNQIYESNNDFIKDNYWSGTEGVSNGAWRQDMSDGYQGHGNKFNGNYVRAVRSI